MYIQQFPGIQSCRHLYEVFSIIANLYIYNFFSEIQTYFIITASHTLFVVRSVLKFFLHWAPRTNTELELFEITCGTFSATDQSSSVKLFMLLFVNPGYTYTAGTHIFAVLCFRPYKIHYCVIDDYIEINIECMLLF